MKLKKGAVMFTAAVMIFGAVPSTVMGQTRVILKGENFEDIDGTMYYNLLPQEDTNYVYGISGISVNDEKWEKRGSSGLYGKDYYIDTKMNRIMFLDEGLYAADGETLKNNDIITIANSDYDDVKLKVKIEGKDFSVEDVSSKSTVKVDKVDIKEKSITLKKGESKKLEAEVLTENTENRTLKWKSNNADAVTVEEDGTIKAVGVGKAVVTASSAEDESVKDTCEITVTENDESIQVKEISLNRSKITLDRGETYQLKAEITPSDAKDKNITWKSKNEKIATVKNGVVKAVGKGETVITATTSNGKTDECTVVVLNNDTKKDGKRRSYSLEEIKSKGKNKKQTDSKDTKKADSKKADSKKDESKKDNKKVSEPSASAKMKDRIFNDVRESDTRYKAINSVYEKGWMMGVGDRMFDPDGTLTRGMAAQILWNKAGKPEPANVSPFLDVTSDAWYAKAVAWAYEQRISVGYGETFGPDDYVTTEQFTIMNDIANGKTPAAYVGGAPNATRGWVAVMISEQ